MALSLSASFIFALLIASVGTHYSEWFSATEAYVSASARSFLLDFINQDQQLDSQGISGRQELERAECSRTCSIEIVESIPENLTFGDAKLPRSTFDAWKFLVSTAQKELDIAAYKSSLRGKHVLGQGTLSSIANAGERIFELLETAAKRRMVSLRMVENYPPKDPGDNEDGKSLERKGLVDRRPLNFRRMFGTGTMHSKFLIADQAHFYLGSANLDWRSLNQKMELGLLVSNCPCLAKDLRSIFNTYWSLTKAQNVSCSGSSSVNAQTKLEPDTTINSNNPLEIYYKSVPMNVFLAASPKRFNTPSRSWDLDAILETINRAQKTAYIHVMDYIPMIVYQEPQRYWPVIDDAIRAAAVERGVTVKLLVAALHFGPRMLHFAKSLQDIGSAADNGSIEIRIFKVPVMTDDQSVVARDRRTHNKFMVTDDTVVIGTSNWSGDYFYGSTGVAFVAQQNSERKPFVDDMRDIFERDWNSPYAHPLKTYMSACLSSTSSPICEVQKPEFAHSA